MDPIEKCLWDALASESADRADLARIVASSADFNAAVVHVRTMFPAWRLGQASCNVLRVLLPDLYLELVGTDLDPFYRDDRVPAFNEWLARHLD